MEKKLFTILVAEDDPNDALLIKRAFSKCGIPNPIHIVTDGEEAIAYFAGTGKYADRSEYPMPDFFITDLKMPRKTGFDVLEWLRANETYAIMPAVVLSSSKQPEDIRRAYTLNANSYFTKPADFAHLQELLRKIYDYWLASERPDIRPS